MKHVITESMIQALRNKTFTDGRIYKTLKEMSKDLSINYLTLSRICSRRQKNIDQDLLNELNEKILGFREATILKNSIPLTNISTMVVFRIREIVKNFIAAEDDLSDSQLHIRMKMNKDELVNFVDGNIALSPLQIVCLIYIFDDKLSTLKRSNSWIRLKETYTYEFKVAPYIVNVYK